MIKKYRIFYILFVFIFVVLSCKNEKTVKFDAIAETARGWQGQIIAEIDQSYVGWDVEIGDADNDGENEILTTGCPDSRLYLFKKSAGGWITRLLDENLAKSFPGMGLVVKVVDLNNDKKNEIIIGTGQETGGIARFYLFENDGKNINKKIVLQPKCNTSFWFR